LLYSLATLIAKLSRALAELFRRLAHAIGKPAILLSQLLPHFGARLGGKQQRDPRTDQRTCHDSQHEAGPRLFLSIHVRAS
jgi:hypothetical protein